MLGLHATNECIKFFVCFPTLLRIWWTSGGGVLYQFDRNNLSVVLTRWHIGSVTICKQCIAAYLFSHILTNFVGIQKVHLFLNTPLLNKTPRLLSARTFVRFDRLLLIHCIYVSVTKPTCPAWLNTVVTISLRLTGKAIMLCSYGITIKITCMCSTTWSIKCWFYVWLQAMRKFDLSVWWKFYKELTVTMVQVPKGMAVSTQGQHYVQ